MIQWLLAQLQHNTLVSGGLVITTLGTLFMSLRRLPGRLWGVLASRLIPSITVMSDDEAYEWVEYWLLAQPYAQQARRFLLRSLWIPEASRIPHKGPQKVSEELAERVPLIIPGTGEHLFRYKTRRVWVHSEIGEPVTKGMSGVERPRTLTIAMWRGNHTLFRQLVDDARKLWSERHPAGIKTFIPVYDEWTPVQGKTGRSLDTLVYDSEVTSFVLSDLQRFLERREWYYDKGIPYHRGYLFDGPPGNGKTSLISALAVTCGRHLAVLSLSETSLTDAGLRNYITAAPTGAFLCIEDIDAAFNGREAVGGSKLTFTGLLNVLDGLAAGERVVFLTTNHKDRLDPALIRAGRVDVHLHLDNASLDQARRLFLKFFPGEVRLAARFVEGMDERSYSMAQLQGHLIAHAEDAVVASEGIGAAV